ncbi:MAG TPA: hypothetical protein VGH10_12970 [Actinomycetota bacterium]|jgi:hypothetical protein
MATKDRGSNKSTKKAAAHTLKQKRQAKKEKNARKNAGTGAGY